MLGRLTEDDDDDCAWVFRYRIVRDIDESSLGSQSFEMCKDLWEKVLGCSLSICVMQPLLRASPF